MKKIIAGFVTVLSLAVILNSCTLNNSGSTTTTTQQGVFLVAQASPNAPHLNIAINSNPFDTAFAYRIYTPYIKANPGTYSFSATGSSSSAPSNTTSVDIEANKGYSLFYIDSFAKLKTALINDVFKAPSSDSIYIRFLNFYPVLNQSLNLIDSTHNNVALSQGRTFNDQQYNPQFATFTEYTSGNYILSLKNAAGTTLKTQTLSLTGGKVYTLIACVDSTKAVSIGLLENYPQTYATFNF